MKPKNNVIQFVPREPINERALLLTNLRQILDGVVREFGAVATLQGVSEIVKESETKIRLEKRVTKQNKVG